MVDYQFISFGNQSYIECLPGADRITGEGQALDLVAACGEYETNRLLLHGECLDEAFFDLSSGLAGQVLLKFAIYRLKAALVAKPEQVRRGKFYDMVLETNRGRDFRVFIERQAAVDWLIGD